jgi:hypothetical protein
VRWRENVQENVNGEEWKILTAKVGGIFRSIKRWGTGGKRPSFIKPKIL